MQNYPKQIVESKHRNPSWVWTTSLYNEKGGELWIHTFWLRNKSIDAFIAVKIFLQKESFYLLTLNDLSQLGSDSTSSFDSTFFLRTQNLILLLCTIQKNYDSIFIVQNSNYIRHVSNINFVLDVYCCDNFL